MNGMLKEKFETIINLAENQEEKSALTQRNALKMHDSHPSSIIPFQGEKEEK